ncbi:unnamed protein product [Bathycoccus prasinos]
MSIAGALTPYEIKRDERVARNKAILAKLIANNPLHQHMMRRMGSKDDSDDDDGERATKKKKKKKIKREINLEDVRRSGRIRKLPAPIYTTFELNEDLGDGTKNRKSFNSAVGKKRKSSESEEELKKQKKSSDKKSQPPSSPQSLKALNAKLKHIYSEFLGHRIETNDGGLKAAVVHELSPIAHPKFSKMSGIQEWRNCVVLYVNVGDKYGNSYDNVFTNCGGCITWFAQPRQDEESSPIRTILSTMSKKEVSCEETKNKALEEGEEAEKLFPKWPVHLFCRMEGETYTYCGRLKALNYEANKRPMKFTFQLLDAPLLRVSQDFLSLVELADGDVHQ